MYLPVNAGITRDAGLIPGLGRSPGEGYGNPLQYSCLGNHVDRGNWPATVHNVTKSWTRLKQLSMHAMRNMMPIWVMSLFNISLFVYLFWAVSGVSCSMQTPHHIVQAWLLKWDGQFMWDLSSPARDQTHVPCIGRRIFSHWTTREVPELCLFARGLLFISLKLYLRFLKIFIF